MKIKDMFFILLVINLLFSTIISNDILATTFKQTSLPFTFICEDECLALASNSLQCSLQTQVCDELGCRNAILSKVETPFNTSNSTAFEHIFYIPSADKIENKKDKNIEFDLTLNCNTGLYSESKKIRYISFEVDIITQVLTFLFYIIPIFALIIILLSFSFKDLFKTGLRLFLAEIIIWFYLLFFAKVFPIAADITLLTIAYATFVLLPILIALRFLLFSLETAIHEIL